MMLIVGLMLMEAYSRTVTGIASEGLYFSEQTSDVSYSAITVHF